MSIQTTVLGSQQHIRSSNSSDSVRLLHRHHHRRPILHVLRGLNNKECRRNLCNIKLAQEHRCLKRNIDQRRIQHEPAMEVGNKRPAIAIGPVTELNNKHQSALLVPVLVPRHFLRNKPTMVEVPYNLRILHRGRVTGVPLSNQHTLE